SRANRAARRLRDQTAGTHEQGFVAFLSREMVPTKTLTKNRAHRKLASDGPFALVGATGFEPATSTTPRFSQIVPSQSANVRKQLYKGVSASRDILPASADVRHFPGDRHTLGTPLLHPGAGFQN